MAHTTLRDETINNKNIEIIFQYIRYMPKMNLDSNFQTLYHCTLTQQYGTATQDHMFWGHKGNEPNQFVGECDHLSLLPLVTEHLPEVDASGRQYTAVGSEVLPVNDKHHIRVETIVKHPGGRKSHSAKAATLTTSGLYAGQKFCQ